MRCAPRGGYRIVGFSTEARVKRSKEASAGHFLPLLWSSQEASLDVLFPSLKNERRFRQNLFEGPKKVGIKKEIVLARVWSIIIVLIVWSGPLFDTSWLSLSSPCYSPARVKRSSASVPYSSFALCVPSVFSSSKMKSWCAARCSCSKLCSDWIRIRLAPAQMLSVVKFINKREGLKSSSFVLCQPSRLKEKR